MDGAERLAEQDDGGAGGRAELGGEWSWEMGGGQEGFFFLSLFFYSNRGI